jgi:flagellar biogenesis protein FliO
METMTFVKVLLFMACLLIAARLVLVLHERGWLTSKRVRHLRLLDSLQLGPERSVHVVEVDDRRLVLGASRGAITVLLQMPAAAEPQLGCKPLPHREVDPSATTVPPGV